VIIVKSVHIFILGWWVTKWFRNIICIAINKTRERIQVDWTATQLYGIEFTHSYTPTFFRLF